MLINDKSVTEQEKINAINALINFKTSLTKPCNADEAIEHTRITKAIDKKVESLMNSLNEDNEKLSK